MEGFILGAAFVLILQRITRSSPRRRRGAQVVLRNAEPASVVRLERSPGAVAIGIPETLSMN